MSRRRHSTPAPATAAPLDDEDLLREILLRLPPNPSSFPRASLVCKRWRGILSDPRFRRRFRKHHRRSPLLGFFLKQWNAAPVFAPLLDPPDCIPVALPENIGGGIRWDFSFSFHGCRHGVAVFLDRKRPEVFLWDTLTAVQRRVHMPPSFAFDHHDTNGTALSAAVLCADSDDCHLTPFKLALTSQNSDRTKTSVCLYESNTGVWGDIMSITTAGGILSAILSQRPSVLVGNALCWLLSGGGILKFDFQRQTLVVIDKLADLHFTGPEEVLWSYQILRGEDGGPGLAVLSVSELSIQLWARKSDGDGVASWVLQKTVQLDERFLRHGYPVVQMLGYDEDTNAIFLSSGYDDFTLQLESMKFKCTRRGYYMRDRIYHPYTSFYTAGNTSSLICIRNTSRSSLNR
ncbi:hypothetical protein BRADI_3g00597v3 [Brachypodium distachyon]|uniref:Uncharacterized protein n=1 Tax=Brachypodium distachyon TaxID=15368 RepID=A0A2K2CUG8_BRADI|nr:hypothetical protein BRADI_3g00597v3 [Brachypodium distachyon]